MSLVPTLVQRLKQVRKEWPEVAVLAEPLALAVRIEPELLRDVRLTLLPASHASLEADLYFSPLISQRTPEWLSVDPPLAHELRKRLAARMRRGGRDEERVRRVRGMLERAHSAVPFEIAREEQIIWMSVEQSGGKAETRRAVNEVLRDLLMRMLQGSDASFALARWFASAAKRMPPLAHETESFALLVFASSSILGGRKIEAKINATLDTFEALTRYLPQSAKRIAVWSALTTRGLHLRSEQYAGYQPVEMPLTNPVLLEARPENGRPILVQFSPGQTAFVPLPARVMIALRTLTRDLLIFRPRAATASPAEAVRAEHADASPFDLFVSYSRRDNQRGRIRELVTVIQAQHRALTGGQELRIFFDTEDIKSIDDWEHRLLGGIRSARLLLACLSPSYLESEYCAKEFIEYLNKHEFSRVPLGEGIMPVYLSEIEWANHNEHTPEWVTELRRGQYFDLRSWFDKGADALKDSTVKARLEDLINQIRNRLERFSRVVDPKGNVDRHNEQFVGRRRELQQLRQVLSLSKVGVLTVIHGLEGIGKTALATEYAYTFAHEYSGGRWQVRCEGKKDLRAAFVSLAGVRDLEFEFTEEEKHDLDLQFERVLRELKKRADAVKEGRVLIVLDNVDQANLLEPAQVQQLPQADWLHLIATTRLGGHNLFSTQKDRAFVAVDELLEQDALALIERYQPNGKFADHAERRAAEEIVRLLGGFTLAVETAAVFLGQFAEDVSCAAFRDRLKKEGLTGLEEASGETSESMSHGEKRLTATVRPTLERLGEAEKLALSFAALLPADHVALPWVHKLVLENFPELGTDAQPGYLDPWQTLLRRLYSLRLFQAHRGTQQVPNASA